MNRITCTVQCPTCRAPQTVTRDEDGAAVADTVPCQGATPDLCTKRLCAACLIECAGCGLNACEEHTAYVGKDRLCHNCIALLVADGAEELTECDDDTAAAVHVMAAAGCCESQTRAALAVRGRMAS